MKEDFELTPEEQAAFSSLPREAMPTAALEERTVRALRARNLVRSLPARHYPLRLALAAAAAVLLLLSGFAVGRRTAAREAAAPYAAMPATQTGERLVVWF